MAFISWNACLGKESPRVIWRPTKDISEFLKIVEAKIKVVIFQTYLWQRTTIASTIFIIYRLEEVEASKFGNE